MRPLNHPQYERTHWTEERRARASAAAKARCAAKRPRSHLFADERNYAGPVHGIKEFILCSDERRANVMGAIARLLSIYGDSARRGNGIDRKFVSTMMGFYTQMAHVVAREAAEALEL